MAELKSIKKGDKVLLRMFTGAFVEAKTVEMADAKKIGFTNKAGVKMVFDKATGKQILPEPKKPQFANFLTEYDEDVEAEALAKKNKPKKSKAATPKKAAKPAPKKSSKKPVEVEEEEEYEDDEDFEEEEDEEEEEDDN